LHFIGALLCFSLHGPAQIITTFAGGHSSGYGGDGGQATAAKLNQAAAVALDAAGNLYISDYANNVIRKVNTEGIISTIAGTGVPGYSGNGGQATDARLYHTAGVAVDNSGNVYIADSWNNVVRVVNASGIISAFAGNDTAGYSGDGGQATAAELDDPNNLTVDGAGNVYIADAHNNVIRKVSTTGIITTFAGNGYNAGTTHGGYSGDNGPATAAELYYPEGVKFDRSGNLYIAELRNSVIRKVNTTGIITTFAGNNTSGYSGDGYQATNAQLKGPYDVSADNAGNVFIADASNNVIRMVNTSGIISTYAGINAAPGYTGDGSPAVDAGLSVPTGCVVDHSGNLYIADDENNAVRLVTSASAGVHSLLNAIIESLTAYPNPNNGTFTVSLHSPIDEKVSVTITNMLGQKVDECAEFTNKPVSIEVEAPPGMYFINATTDHGVWFEKIIIN